MTLHQDGSLYIGENISDPCTGETDLDASKENGWPVVDAFCLFQNERHGSVSPEKEGRPFVCCEAVWHLFDFLNTVCQSIPK